MSIFEIHNNFPNQFNCTINDVSYNNITNTSCLILNKTALTILKKNSRKSYREIASTIEKKEMPNWKTKCKNRIIKFNNAVITNTGIIINSSGVWKLGGCTDNRIDNQNMSSIVNYYRTVIKTQKLYNKLISVAGFWTYGVWHFPMEALVGLRLINQLDNSYLHIAQKNKLCLEWLKLYNSNIADDKILDGTVFAKELLLPELGKCGNPYFEQIIWLKETIYHSITQQKENNVFILIKRNKKRIVKNHEIIEKICKNYCEKNHLVFYLHDDLFLPPLKKQLEIFNKAKIIIGPHGGGGVNLISTKEKTYFIEFLNEQDINLCYARLAHLLNVNYFGIPYSLSEGVNINYDLLPILQQVKRLLI